MSLTPYHAKYFAFDLTRRFPSNSIGKLAGALVDAQVDLNPHQVDAALFAFRSPLCKGALLADEVGLGKTIEAGLVLSQKWAEQRRKILVITPSSLRKQWYQELTEKFFLPCRILEAKPYNLALKNGNFKPFVSNDSIVICSYQFVKSKASDVHEIPWDLVVIDEAHRLRNVYKPSNVISNIIKTVLRGKDKLLLTATPLQNSLMELFGLVSFIDELAFGDFKSFKEQFSQLNQEQVFQTLKNRLKPICHRTLRRQVLPYIKYTKRLPLVEEFTPNESEDRLYQLISDYLRRDNLHALPVSQRSLMTLVLRKLLASSTFAIAGALKTLSNRLKAKLKKQEPKETLAESLSQEYEAFEETSDEWEEPTENEVLTEENKKALEKEIKDLDEFTQLATSITLNAKGLALLKALKIAFSKATVLGAKEKAIIFTESRKTQDYLVRLLSESNFSEGILLFNGSNTDTQSKQILIDWLEKNRGTDLITGSKSADMRSALVDYFRDTGRIMIATEAAAEGINLQFCSLVVNYDLPWNPQRIEQRIGRCHRYGQKFDVVVVNFVNRNNAADQRVFQLLSQKFQLFEGVFGASDEVLGALEAGVDFEKRIALIYQNCRKSEEIQIAFDQLQKELNIEINESMTRTRQQLLENFDDEVREKLKTTDEDSKTYLNKFEKLLMRLTKFELHDRAEFSDDFTFELKSCPFPGEEDKIPLGKYELPRRSRDSHFYRISHPLGQRVIGQAKDRELVTKELHFLYEDYQGKITILEPLKGQSGLLALSLFSVESLDLTEDHLIFTISNAAGKILEEEVAKRMFTLPAKVLSPVSFGENELGTLLNHSRQRQTGIQQEISQRNSRFFEEEATKLDGWADDLKVGLEREIKDYDRQIKEARRMATAALTLEDKLAGQKAIKALESERNQKRRSLFDAQDQIDKQREELIGKIEGKLNQKTTVKNLFSIKWKLV